MSRRIRLLFALVALVGLFFIVDPVAVFAVLADLQIVDIGALLVVGVLLIYVSALKWSVFLEALSEKVSVVRLFGLYLVGYFVNLLLPSYVGGDLVRSWYVGKRVGQREALVATILERYTGLVAMVFLALIFMWRAPAVSAQIQLFVTIVGLGLVAGSFVAMSSRTVQLLHRVPYLKKVVGELEKVQSALRFAAGQPRLVIESMGLSLLFHVCTVVNTLVCAHAVGWDSAPVFDLFVVLPLILLVGAIPLTPQGLGIQEGAFLYFLHAIGATPAQALSIGVILRAKSYVLALFGGVIWFCIREKTPDGVRKNSQ